MPSYYSAGPEAIKRIRIDVGYLHRASVFNFFALHTYKSFFNAPSFRCQVYSGENIKHCNER